MNVIITMAGLGSRFREAGYNCPKYMIEAKGKTLFEWSMDSLLDYNEYVSKYIFIVRTEDNASGFISSKCIKYGVKDYEIIELDYQTDGQATTAMLAMDYCNKDEEILIYNIDTYVEPGELKYMYLSGDGHIPCFKGEGTHWSFVKLDSAGRVEEIKEKVRISDNCTIGAYYFGSASLYEQMYNEFYFNNNNTNKEKYIAPLYNYMLQKGKEINISLVDSEKVHVLGTPNELEEFLKS